MKDTDFSTVVTITGPKVNLVKMLNAALRGVGADIVIDGGEDSESILRKLSDDKIVFQLQDFLNQGNEALPREGVPEDEDGTEFFEDYGLRLADIQEKDKELTVVFHFWSAEYPMGEWDFEKDYECFFQELLPRYDCKASIVKGAEETPQWADSFRFNHGTLEHYCVEPLAASACYQINLENLVKINPDRYLPFLVDSMKHQIECIQDRLEFTLERLNPTENETADAKEHDDEIPF